MDGVCVTKNEMMDGGKTQKWMKMGKNREGFKTERGREKEHVQVPGREKGRCGGLFGGGRRLTVTERVGERVGATGADGKRSGKK